MLLIILTSLYIGSFGILMSTIFRKTSTATAVTYIWVMLITFGTIFVTFISNVFLAVENNSLNSIFLLNPVMTLFALLDSQMGLPEVIGNYISFQNNNDFIMNNWYTISLAVQAAVTIINIGLANHFLNPFKHIRKR
jgi:hypothetical protein